MHSPLGLILLHPSRSNSRRIAGFAIAAALAIGTGLAGLPRLAAQSAPGTNGELAGPPPGSAAAVRLSDVEGGVQLSNGSMILASQALNNTPVFEGTLITTGDDGRAELQFDDGSVVRITPDSALLISVLRKQGGSAQSELNLRSGLAYFELQSDSENEAIRVRFGDNILTSSGFTVMRVRYDTPPGQFAVFSGNAHLAEGTALSLDLHGGESVILNAENPSDYQLAESIEPDSWDEWNSDRDEALTSVQTDRTVANNALPDSNNPAWGDLDQNGNWYNVPGQGYVWSPYEAQNSAWDPYGCGSWMWTPAFGYMWVSCESWGYMPYMSGMWNYYSGFGWGWMPGYGGWYNNGGGWTANVGQTAGIHYQPPRMPHGGPVKPPVATTFPVRATYQPYPIVGVNRIRNFEHAAPIRSQGAPLTIGGTRVQPLRPTNPTQRVTYSAFGESRSSAPRYPGTHAGSSNSFAGNSRFETTARPVFTGPVSTFNGAARGNASAGMGVQPQAPGQVYNPATSYRPSAPGRGFSGSSPTFRPSGGNFGGARNGGFGGATRSGGGNFGGARNGGFSGAGGGHMGGGGGFSGGGGHIGGGASMGGGGGAAHGGGGGGGGSHR